MDERTAVSAAALRFIRAGNVELKASPLGSSIAPLLSPSAATMGSDSKVMIFARTRAAHCRIDAPSVPAFAFRCYCVDIGVGRRVDGRMSLPCSRIAVGRRSNLQVIRIQDQRLVWETLYCIRKPFGILWLCNGKGL